jgi:hypothetical protein
MNMGARNSFELPRWVALIHNAASAKMAGSYTSQAQGSKPHHTVVNCGNPSTNSNCGTVPSAARTGPGCFNPPFGVSALFLAKTGKGIAAQPWLYVLRRILDDHAISAGFQVLLQKPAAHSSLLRSGYPARWVVFRQGFGRAWTSCRVGYFFHAVEVVKQSLGRFAQAFRRFRARFTAKAFDVDHVIYGDVPFLSASVLHQLSTRTNQDVGKVSQGGQGHD